MERVLDKKELEKIITEAKKGGRFCFDGDLYCEQTMSPTDNEAIIEFWEKKGLTPTEETNNQKCWKDLCLIQFPETEPTLPCNWIEIFSEENNMYAKLKQ